MPLEQSTYYFACSKFSILQMETVMLEFNSAGRQVFLAFNIANRVQDTRSAGKRKWHKADGSKSIFLTGRGELSAAEYVDIVVVQTKEKYLYLHSSARITQQPSKLAISTKHYPPALVDEHYPVCITLTNEEPTSVEAIIRVEIKAAENQGTLKIVLFYFSCCILSSH